MGITAGIVAAVFHIFSHAATKALLFLSASDLSDASDRGRTFPQLRGAGLRNIPAGVTFTIGALSMVGVPLLAGFTSKLLFAEAALDDNMAYTAVTADCAGDQYRPQRDLLPAHRHYHLYTR